MTTYEAQLATLTQKFDDLCDEISKLHDKRPEILEEIAKVKRKMVFERHLLAKFTWELTDLSLSSCGLALNVDEKSRKTAEYGVFYGLLCTYYHTHFALTPGKPVLMHEPSKDITIYFHDNECHLRFPGMAGGLAFIKTYNLNVQFTGLVEKQEYHRTKAAGYSDLIKFFADDD